MRVWARARLRRQKRRRREKTQSNIILKEEVALNEDLIDNDARNSCEEITAMIKCENVTSPTVGRERFKSIQRTVPGLQKECA